MKYIGLSGRSIAVVAGMLAAVRVASAVPVPYTYTGETGGGVIMTVDAGHYTGRARVGEFILTTSNPDFQQTIKSYCTDVGVNLAQSFNYTPTALSAATGFAPVWITGGGQNAARLWYFDKDFATTATQTAGLQLAIWELLYNNVFGGYSIATFANPANNGFYVTSTDSQTEAAEAYAASILNSFNILPELPPDVEWLAPTLENGQIGGSQGLFYEEESFRGVPDASSTLNLLGLVIGSLLGVAIIRSGKKMMISWENIESRISSAEQQV